MIKSFELDESLSVVIPAYNEEGNLSNLVEQTLEDAKKIVKDMAKDKKVSLTEPSYGDVLGSIISRYTGNTSGTTCIGTDIEPDTVECWTTKSKISEKNFFLLKIYGMEDAGGGVLKVFLFLG